MKLKSVKLLLWAIFVMLTAQYLLNFKSNFWSTVSLYLAGLAIVFALCSWIISYISDDD